MSDPLDLFQRGALVVGITFGALAALESQSRAALPAEAAEFFENKIRPVLVAECIECHGAQKTKGGLRLDSRPGWQKGGDSGVVIIPGKPLESLLLRTIRHEEPDLKMPDKAPKLADPVLADFAKWISMGAPDPRDNPPAADAAKPAWPQLLAARRTWWSLQPLAHTEPPRAADTAPNAQPVDLFLNDAIRKAGLEPNPAATPAVLARRLHFLLTGLPPTPDEVRSFVRACGSDAASRAAAVHERTAQLLDLPAFGEHWARRWMDLVRYAESHGSESDPEIPNAHLYRDYLIRAFNADVPLQQLIREHLAGDLLEKPRISSEGINESRIGPAHLRMVDHGFQPVDSLDDQVKAVDNQIDVVTKAFQALTVSCARCHDHKFDAISQRDYTALYGVFASVRPAQIAVDSPERLQIAGQDGLARLKLEIRAALADVWMKELPHLAQTLSQKVHPPGDPELEPVQKRLTQASRELASLEWARISGERDRRSPAPYALWTFSAGPDELLGRVQSKLKGNAAVRDGALILGDKGSFLETSILPAEIRERTLEAWLMVADPAQRGGGVLGIEEISTHAFDTIVYAEKSARRWLPGSNNFQRTEQPEGAEETAAATERVHIAISYLADGTIATYRNGVPYGKPYRKSGLHTYPAGDSRILIGLRHTGAGNGFFQGSIDEARLYDHALSAEEVAASFAAGSVGDRPSGKGAGPGAVAAEPLAKLRAEVASLRAELAKKEKPSTAESLSEAASKAEHPLHLALKASALPAKEFMAFAAGYRTRMTAKIAEDRAFNEGGGFEKAWDLGASDAARWFTEGPDVRTVKRGEFRVLPGGDSVLESLMPAGVAAASLIPKSAFGGILSSPEFPLKSKSVSVKFAGANGAMVRLVPDNYPLGNNGSIFAKAVVQRTQSEWTRLDTAYRVGSSVYLEFSTPGYQTRPTGPEKSGSKFDPSLATFVVERIVFHENPAPPRPTHEGLAALLGRIGSNEAAAVIDATRDALVDAVRAWKDGALTEPQREILDSALKAGLLAAKHDSSPLLAAKVAQYRSAVDAIPTPTTVPGVIEHRGFDAVFRNRGDHKQPGATVPRSYLEVLGSPRFDGPKSGRRALADQILSDQNPLTARVLANRIWYWVFGAGIVPTLDNFGRMGGAPTHPELLDYLALQLPAHEWSLKRMLALLVETEAFQRSSTPSPSAQQKDPGNALLSHASVRRLEAEPIRDALLMVSGSLDAKLFGPPVGADVPRRSVYLSQRRNSMPALPATFDAPVPFTTHGRRDVTTVPAQSLTLLNNPAILAMADRWAKSVARAYPDRAARIDAMFWSALGRPPTADEARKAADLLQTSGSSDDLQPLAHALFNLKEFLYLR